MKGQLGIETILALTVLTFFLLIMTVYYISQNESIAITGNYLGASKVCFDLKNAIDSVSSSGNKSRISLTLSNKIEQKDYYFSIEPENKVVRIMWSDSSYTCPIFSNVTTSYTASGLIGYWRLDEGSGAAASDSSGYGNGGTLYSGAQVCSGGSCPNWVDGRYGKALKFDGVNDYVSISTLSPVQNNNINTFTFEAWVKIIGDTGSIQQIFEGRTNTGSLPEIYIERILSGSLQFLITDTNGNIHYAYTNSLSLNKWYHVVGTYDGSVQKIYVNAELQPNPAFWSGNFRITTGIKLGKDYEGDIQYFNGIIDEVRIYNRALTADEIWLRFSSFRFDVYNSDGNIIVQRS